MHTITQITHANDAADHPELAFEQVIEAAVLPKLLMKLDKLAADLAPMNSLHRNDAPLGSHILDLEQGKTHCKRMLIFALLAWLEVELGGDYQVWLIKPENDYPPQQ